MKKIHSKNNFELCYLRHQYLRRTNINPTKEDLAPYAYVINSQSGKTFSTYKKLFWAVGLDFSDLVRTSEAHLISFLGLFAIEVDKAKFAKFEEAFLFKNKYLPAERDILDKNRAIFTMFLKQRMEDMVRVCRQKVRNVRGVPMQQYHLYSGKTLPMVNNEELIANHEKNGFRKVDAAIFRAIKKKAKPENPLSFNFNGLWYISIPTNYKPLELLDFSNAGLDPRDTLHNRTPEDIVIMDESSKRWTKEYKKFRKISSNKKLSMLKSFIENNKSSTLFQEELKTARKMLARLES